MTTYRLLRSALLEAQTHIHFFEPFIVLSEVLADPVEPVDSSRPKRNPNGTPTYPSHAPGPTHLYPRQVIPLIMLPWVINWLFLWLLRKHYILSTSPVTILVYFRSTCQRFCCRSWFKLADIVSKMSPIRLNKHNFNTLVKNWASIMDLGSALLTAYWGQPY